MTKSVQKYSLPKTSDPIMLRMPPGAEILHFGVYVAPGIQSEFDIWVAEEAVPDTMRMPRVFYIVGYSEQIPENTVHVGTTQDRGRAWHLFEEITNDSR